MESGARLYAVYQKAVGSVTLNLALNGWIDWVIVGGESGPGAREMKKNCGRRVGYRYP